MPRELPVKSALIALLIPMFCLTGCNSAPLPIHNYQQFISAYGNDHVKTPKENGRFQILYRKVEFPGVDGLPTISCDYLYNFEKDGSLANFRKVESSCNNN